MKVKTRMGQWILRQIIKTHKNNQTAKEIVDSGWVAFGKLNQTLRNENILQYSKTKVFDTCMLPVLTTQWSIERAMICTTTFTNKETLLGCRTSGNGNGPNTTRVIDKKWNNIVHNGLRRNSWYPQMQWGRRRYYFW